MKVSNDIVYVGVNDHDLDLFEGQYKVPNGMAYNSYVICDEKTVVMDSVDSRFCSEWLANIDRVLGGKAPDYLVVQHMEPDHSSSIARFADYYPTTTIVSSAKAFDMIEQFFGKGYEDRRLVVKEGDTLSLGAHTLSFIGAPMVHWPEVIMTYDDKDKVLFSADGFGKFGALDREEPWEQEASRYYFGIVGKYGAQVQAVLKKASALDIEIICPLHGPVLTENLSYYIGLYDTWSSYKPMHDAVTVAFTSIYGNTTVAVRSLCRKLSEKGVTVNSFDLARDDKSKALAKAFENDKLILATTTYNADIFPFMREFIADLKERGYKNRKVGIIENGSWGPMAAKKIKEQMPAEPNVTYYETVVTLKSALDETSKAQLDKLVEEILT